MFMGRANIVYGDGGKASVMTEKQCNVTGNAIIKNKEMDVESITITQIK